TGADPAESDALPRPMDVHLGRPDAGGPAGLLPRRPRIPHHHWRSHEHHDQTARRPPPCRPPARLSRRRRRIRALSRKFYIRLAATYHDPAIAIVDDTGRVLFAEACERHL